MLFWENEFTPLGEVHHLTVLCYHLQHPGLLSPEGLHFSIQLLAGFLEHDVTPQQARLVHSAEVDSRRRAWKITATPAARGAYARPVDWHITAPQVVAEGSHNYCAAVRQWAQSILEALKASGHFNPQGLTMDDFDRFLQPYPVELHPMARQARALIRAAMPTALEQFDPSANLIAYGTDRTVKGLVFGIILYKTYLNLMLAQGAALPDPHHMLRGTGKKARHIKITRVEDLLAEGVNVLLQAAVNQKIHPQS